MRSIIAFIVLLLAGINAHATNLEFVGTGDYSINSSRTQVTVNFDRLTNQDPNTRSGTIYLQLWASPDNDPSGSGFELTPPQSLANFSGAGNGTLEPNSSFVNISFGAPYSPPPEGSYYVFLLALEYPNLDTYVASVPATDNPSFLDNPGSGGGGTLPPPPDPGTGSGQGGIELVCDICEYKLDGDFIELIVTAVRNNRDSGFSGSLRLTLWATDTPYEGASIPGHMIAELDLGQLDAQARFFNIHRSLALSPPPDGTYYVNLLLEEYNSGFQTMDYITFNNTQSFRSSTSSPDAAGGSGGGGSLSSTGLVVLLLIMALRLAKRRASKFTWCSAD